MPEHFQDGEEVSMLIWALRKVMSVLCQGRINDRSGGNDLGSAKNYANFF